MPFTDDQFTRERLAATVDGRETVIEVLPKLGATLVSFTVDGRELLHFDQDAFRSGDMNGCFHMFPTPCRIPDATYFFQGETYTQTKRGEKVDIHGLMRDEPVRVDRDAASLTATLEVTPDSPVHEGYPFPCTFALTHTIIAGGVEIAFRYRNDGGRDAPFGYGLHPFWRVPGARKDTAVRVPCDYLMDLDERLIPTGQLTPVDNVLDLRESRPLEGVDIDNLFWGRRDGVPALVEWRDDGKRLTLEASDVFTHMIAYAPAGKPFACVEYLTCAPNHINLYRETESDVSGLVIVQPGGTVDGWVRYTVEDL